MSGGTTFVPFPQGLPDGSQFAGFDGSNFTTGTAFQAVLKEYYGPQVVKNMVYKNNPFFAMVKKEEDWSGQVVPLPIIYGNPQGRSATFATTSGQTYGAAQNQQTASAATRFVLTWAQDYQLVTVSNLAQLASRNDAGAFLKAITTEMNNGLQNIKNSASGALFRDGTGYIGQVGSAGVAAGTGVIVLVDPQSVTQFEVNMPLFANVNPPGSPGAPRAAVGYVIAVNAAAGTITVSTTLNTWTANPAAWAAGDYLLVAGDSTAAGVGLKMVGLAGWLPVSAPGGSDNFFGVNRSAHPTRLGGVRWAGTQQTIEEALIDSSSFVAREDGNPEVCVTNFTSYAALEKALGSKVQYVAFEHDEVGIRFKGIKIHGPNSEIAIFPDRSCPGLLAYLLDMDSWVLGSMKEVPHILTELDGLTQLRAAQNDASEVRIGYYAQLGCNAPGHNAVVQLQS